MRQSNKWIVLLRLTGINIFLTGLITSHSHDQSLTSVLLYAFKSIVGRQGMVIALSSDFEVELAWTLDFF